MTPIEILLVIAAFFAGLGPSLRNFLRRRDIKKIDITLEDGRTVHIEADMAETIQQVTKRLEPGLESNTADTEEKPAPQVEADSSDVEAPVSERSTRNSGGETGPSQPKDGPAVVLPPPVTADVEPRERRITRRSDEFGGDAAGGLLPSSPADPDSPDYHTQSILFGTDRDRLPDGEVQVFGARRANTLTLGQAVITIPSHSRRRVGEIPRPRRRLGGLWRERERASQHFTLYSCDTLSETAFLAEAAATLRDAKLFRNSAFVFLHGFNVPFQDALFRTAQMAFDIQFDGPAFLYSWPAMGHMLSYATDMDSAMQTVPHLDTFLDHVLQVPGLERLHLVAHSMGNLALATFMREVGTKLQARSGKSIDQLILAAPDIDVGMFQRMAHHFERHAKGVTLYACGSDVALTVSKGIRNDYPRAGDVTAAGPIVSPFMDTIDVTAVGTDIFSLRHSLYAEDRGLLDDLGQLMLHGMRPPNLRMPTLRTVETGDGPYWIMPR